MASGRHTKLVGQAGEYLVAAELSRRGLIATTFTGNVPDYDIIASTEKGKHISVQVKTTTGISWQFGNITKYFELELQEQVQIVGETLPSPVDNLVYVFVMLQDYGNDRFFLCTWDDFCETLATHHREYLAKHGGVRPKQWKSLHAAIKTSHIEHFEDRWNLIEEMLE
ncbi:MAG: hypothetical protein IAF02_29170 [Anaerolineae bacterium]|nr:hypothetical protein [Anaerolineae bacterium]